MNYNYSNPFHYDPFSEALMNDAKRSFSRFHLGVFIYLLVSNLIVVVLNITLFLTLDEEQYLSIVQNEYYIWAAGVLQMYVIGLPLLCLITRGMTKTNLIKSKMRLSEFLIIFVITQPLITAGSMISSVFTDAIGSLRGEEITDSVSELIDSSSLWLTLLIAVVIGPIIEEFIFRKIMIDRLAKFGTVPVIIVSGVSFGIFHGNFSQLFYASLLGMILAYITFKTGNWLYSALMHVSVNFFNGVLPTIFNDMQNKLIEAENVLAAGGEIDRAKTLIMVFAVDFYTLLQLAILIAGAVFLFLAVRRRWYTFDNNIIRISVPREKVFSCIFANPGTIMFFSLSMVLFTLSIL